MGPLPRSILITLILLAVGFGDAVKRAATSFKNHILFRSHTIFSFRKGLTRPTADGIQGLPLPRFLASPSLASHPSKTTR